MNAEAKQKTKTAEASAMKTLCCYSGCRRKPSFSLYLAFKREHGGERRVPLCGEHAAFLSLNDSFVPAATFAGQGVEDTGPWSDWKDA